jgi:hypothetical protein
MDKNIGEIIKSTEDKDLLLSVNFIHSENNFMSLKVVQYDGVIVPIYCQNLHCKTITTDDV